MPLLSQVLIALVALIHCYIVWLEMAAWTTRGPRVFKSLPAKLFPPTKVLAGNQELYNGLLMAGLYGVATARPRILLVQAVPALLALGVLWLA